MTHTFRNKGQSSDSYNSSEELPLRPRFRSGTESRSKNRGSGLLKQVSRATKSIPQSSRYGPRNLRRGAGRSTTKTNLQRVVIKAHIVRNKGLRKRGLETHLTYLQRDGVGIDGEAPKAFDLEHYYGESDAAKSIKEWTEDRHHFRFIISPEKSQELDLKNYTKDFIQEMERDLKTKLEWMAVTHHNTDNPHIHLLVRGKDDAGFDLVMSRDYLSRGMRASAQELATRELGIRQKKDIEQERINDLYKVRATGLDYKLMHESEGDERGLIDLRKVPPKQQKRQQQERQYEIERLRFLQRLELSKEVSAGLWRVNDNFIEDLKKRAVETDIIKTMHQRMRGIEPSAELGIYDREQGNSRALKGTVIHKGLVDELQDQTYIILKDEHGKAHHISLAGRTRIHGPECEIGDEVSVTVSQASAVRKSDRTISQVAVDNSGIYDIEKHKDKVERENSLPPSVPLHDYFRNYQKRANALEKGGHIERIAEGKWKVPESLIGDLEKTQIKTLEVQNLSRTHGRER